MDVTMPSSDVLRLVEGLLSTRAPRQPTTNDFTVYTEEQGPKGDPGSPGPAGPAGAANGTTAEYIHVQAIPSPTWTIPHNLNTVPDVTLVDITGEQLFAELVYPNPNTVTVLHGSPNAGTAYLRG